MEILTWEWMFVSKKKYSCVVCAPGEEIILFGFFTYQWEFWLELFGVVGTSVRTVFSF